MASKHIFGSSWNTLGWPELEKDRRSNGVRFSGKDSNESGGAAGKSGGREGNAGIAGAGAPAEIAADPILWTPPDGDIPIPYPSR